MNLNLILKRISIYLIKFFCLFIELLIFIIIRLNSDKFILKLIKFRLKKLFIIGNVVKKEYCERIVLKYLKFSQKSNFHFSTCLSRSILCRFLLDLIDKPNYFVLGMVKDTVGDFVAHAWLTDCYGNLLGEDFLKKEKIVELKVFK